MIDELDQATPVLGGSNVAILLTDRRRHAAHHFDIDRILRVVLAALTDLELHLATALLPSTFHSQIQDERLSYTS